eukprot:gene39238-48058_t
MKILRVPLIEGLPLVLTDHLNRELGLLRGTRVTCVSWAWDHREPFYPVMPDSGSRGVRRKWNAGSKQNPVWVMRTQLPLAAGYAITCHAAPLNLPPGANPIAAYSSSRVRRRSDLLIISRFKPD